MQRVWVLGLGWLLSACCVSGGANEPSRAAYIRPRVSEPLSPPERGPGDTPKARSGREAPTEPANARNENEVQTRLDTFAALPFAGRATVRYDEFLAELRELAGELSSNANVRAAHAQLLSEHGLTDVQVPLESFSRTRLVFESARDGGLWDLRWAITDQMPWSDRIWEQWTERASELEAALPKLAGEAGPSAEAECDELSALFAMLVRDLSVSGKVALHWPYWNHVVAVWEVPRDPRHVARIVVPTSQVFLSPEASLGTRELPTERVLFAYARHDLKFDAEIPGALARFLLGRSRVLGGASSEVLSARRARLGGS